MTTSPAAGRRWTWDGALTGIVPPAISPLDAAREIDEGAIGVLVEHVLEGGSSGLFILGGCGEGAWLTPRQRGIVVRAFVRAAAGRVPVLAGVMLPATAPAMEAARQAAAEGADAVVVGSPYYFGVDGTAQRRHIETVIEAAGRPALLYNIPQCTHQVLAPATVAELARDSRVLGIKDSAGDFVAFQAFLAVKATRADFRVLQGHEHLVAASLRMGGDGLVPGLANVVPALLVELRAAAARDDGAACTRLQGAILDLCAIHEIGHWLPALKAACAMIGIGSGIPALPLVPSTEAERRAIAAVLARHGIGPASAERPRRPRAGPRRRLSGHADATGRGASLERPVRRHSLLPPVRHRDGPRPSRRRHRGDGRAERRGVARSCRAPASARAASGSTRCASGAGPGLLRPVAPAGVPGARAGPRSHRRRGRRGRPAHERGGDLRQRDRHGAAAPRARRSAGRAGRRPRHHVPGRARVPEPLHVVHFDAHLDYLPFVHGLELTNSHPFRHIARMAHVRSLTQVGIRSLRNSQVMMDDSLGDGNRIVTMEEFRDVTPRGLVDRIPRDAACYVSVDVDVLDLPLVPGCVSAEPNGFLYAELRDTLRALAEHTRIVGFDLVEVNPMLDIGTGITSYLAAHTIVEFLGWLCAQPWWIAGRDARGAARAGVRL